MDSWLEAFYRGDRRVIEEVYRKHYADVDAGAARVLRGADRETVVHDVFLQLLLSEAFRRNFQGGQLGAWLARVGLNHAVNHLRRTGREQLVPQEDVEALLGQPAPLDDSYLVAKDLFAKFRARALPAKWAPVFEACFVGGLDQRTAAQRLGLSRTTLAYQWLRVKWLLEKFVKENAS